MDCSRFNGRSSFVKILINIFNYFIGLIIFCISSVRLKFDKTHRYDFYYVVKKLNGFSQKNNFSIKTIKKAIILIEDKRFGNHLGVDPFGLLRAIFKRFYYQRLEGASTIEMQLIRIITNKRELSLIRKLNEICLAVLISHKYSKIQILEFYCLKYKFSECNSVYELSLKECDNANKISNVEATVIAARLKYPFLTKHNFSKYLKRVRTVEIMLSNYN